MKQLLIVLWIFWAQMFVVFGTTSFYFVRTSDFPRLAVSGPLFLLVLVAGWRLILRTRRDWNVVDDSAI